MRKLIKHITCILTGLLITHSAHATLINVGYDTYNAPYLNAVDYFSNTRPMTSSITDWRLLYEDTDGTGTLSINSSSTLFGDLTINNASLTTNTNGSLHVDGTINFLNTGAAASFFGDIIITASWNEFDNTTIFDFSTAAFAGANNNGLFMPDGPLAGNLLELHVTSSLLAIVDNPFPTYSPVPVPAAIWLFGSGLAGLFAATKRKSKNWKL